MGTWDTGPFDNDTAADWSYELQDADPAERPGVIRHALTAAAEETGYLDSATACEAIAAAAIVASTVPGGQPITSAYAPDFLIEGGTVELASDIAPLAVRALDNVLGEHSEWRDLWLDTDADTHRPAFDSVINLRTVLQSAW
ncbi:DUF4259 domain-containing protein [Nocardia transvalensis]|uniref:DUF4259 domain-containing protein n=1 Tax=Nocardia transvalensis TaxID=37333 RepID=UPI001894051B|nr:DUF4259 domain-containing protein [Nocardia transvalensis]MBF6331144.1 DUF4259 domain-containing protein [Nocardia transvalensis]